MKIIKRVIAVVLSLAVILIAVVAYLFRQELRSLASWKKLDDYGLFQMTYYGDYGFDEFLKRGAENDGEIQDFVTKRLLKGLPIKIDIVGGGCTVFMAKNEKGEIIFGRNFDFTYAPSLQLYTKPKNGYASVSTVNLAFAGYGADNLPGGWDFHSFMTLAGPYLPFDGMNEKGVAIALLAVPQAQPGRAADKVTLNTTTAIRLVLDKAADVQQAVELLKNYNIYFSGGIDCHYLIADRFGNSVLVEYWDGALQTVTTLDDYQVASNFIAYNDLNLGEGYSEFERYDTVIKALQSGKGVLTKSQATELLAEVGSYGENQEDKLQWTVLYDLTELSGVIFAHRQINNQINFSLVP